MGRAKLIGVDVREKSIRIKFTYMGKQRREPVLINGVAAAPTNANINMASKLVKEVREKIANGTFDYRAMFPNSKHAPKSERLTGDQPFFDLIDRWHNQLSHKDSTIANYKQQKDNFWKVHVPNKPIKDIVHSDIVVALLKGKGWKPKTYNNQLSIIKGVFELAVIDRQIKENPTKDIAYLDVQQSPPDPFLLSEVVEILASIREHYSEQILNYIQFQFFTGLRTSEAIALIWDNVDFKRGEILIESVIVYDKEQNSTKTSKSRKVKLTKEALSALISQKKYSYSRGGRVFHDPYYNEPWLYHRITRASFWTKTLKRLGMRHRRTYCTRHTYASIGLMAGANPAFMARQLGHNKETFFNVYATWIDGKHDEREMSKIESAIALERH